MARDPPTPVPVANPEGICLSALARAPRHIWRALVVVGAAAAAAWMVGHGVAGTHWSDVLRVLEQLSWPRLLALSVAWLTGLGIYSTVLSAALPGLGVRRGLLLNLSGSAVANAVPLGGALATALNWRMVRRWGHSNSAFATFCVLTNVLDVAAKLVLPLVAVGALLALSAQVPQALWTMTVTCSIALLAVAGILVGLRPGGRVSSVAGRWTRLRAGAYEQALRIRAVFLAGWRWLVPASLGYVAAQVLLLWLALSSVGLHASLPVVLTAAAIERLATLVPLTPGGAGVAEAATIAWLLAAGLPAAAAVAGVLVYRVFLFAMEIPVGALLLGVWAWLQRDTWIRREGDGAA
ncbi:MAG: lysylphosphatidylglycerol synthase transmembrane domain-containing protein [Nocardioidaceae bacterium]